MWLRLLTVALLLCQLSPRTAIAQEIHVITSQSSEPQEITIKQLRNIFLKKSRVNDSGLSWIPVNLIPDHPLRQAFSEKLFNQQPEEMEQYWNTQYFNGITPPYVVASEEAMRRFIVSTPGAIGYISSCHSDASVHVVLKFLIPDPANQTCGNPSKD